QEECRAFPGPMAPQPPIHPWRRPLVRGLGARSSVTGSVFPTDMGYIGASGFASEKYFCRREPAPERRALFMGVARPCSADRGPPRMALACCEVGHFVRRGSPDPAVRPTVGVQVTRRGSGTGRPPVAEDGRVRRTLPEPAFEVPGSSREWLGGATDAHENLKKLRRQLGLRNN